MIGAKAYGVASTVFGTISIGASMKPRVVQEIVPTIVPFVGPVPVFALGVGVLTAILVRVVVMTSSPQKLWSYNVAVTALSAIGAATFIIDHQIGPGNSFWVGSSFGAAGVGIVQVSKSRLFAAIFAGIKSGFVSGISDKSDEPEKSDPTG